eukprot:scaffold78023_cov54-Phaeocystis_antarctica.AAC.1
MASCEVWVAAGVHLGVRRRVTPPSAVDCSVLCTVQEAGSWTSVMGCWVVQGLAILPWPEAALFAFWRRRLWFVRFRAGPPAKVRTFSCRHRMRFRASARFFPRAAASRRWCAKPVSSTRAHRVSAASGSWLSGSAMMARMASCMSGWRRVLRRSVVRTLGLGMEVPREGGVLSGDEARCDDAVGACEGTRGGEPGVEPALAAHLFDGAARAGTAGGA